MSELHAPGSTKDRLDGLRGSFSAVFDRLGGSSLSAEPFARDAGDYFCTLYGEAMLQDWEHVSCSLGYSRKAPGHSLVCVSPQTHSLYHQVSSTRGVRGVWQRASGIVNASFVAMWPQKILFYVFLRGSRRLFGKKNYGRSILRRVSSFLSAF